MKRMLIIALSGLLIGSAAFAQDDDLKQSIKDRKIEAKAAKSELNAKASKAAKKAARTYAKEGWIVAPGQIPLEKQLDKVYMMKYEFEESGLPKYMFGEAVSPGKTFDAAKMQAQELAKMALAGQLETEITALTESTVGNEQLSQTDAESIVKTVQASKSLIAQKLGRVIPVVETYRETKDKAIEVSITYAYNTKMALEAAKQVIKKKLEEEGKDLHEQLDAMNIEVE